ncbi:RagB/SusD family nutrient uptake outer membrane protein [Hymenobacter sp.]|uniref:RagB/SusD family nutrient uptake outer membrane protein n=1 Tax=Hymenobacter sp. TaxID=1898978 RepID=UPI00286A11D8|nr:RagB/SusD family nutrient uptake outer membrane protein [Hymenobacter sp.]
MKTLLSKKTLAAACAALLALGTASCQNDLLNPEPLTLLSDKVVFETPERIALQVNGLYRFVKTGGFLGGRFQIFNDIRSNEFINRTSNGVTGQSVWNHTLTEASQNDVVTIWTNGYAAINQINVFLDGMDANAAKFVAPVFPATFATTATNYRAEARLLRALCYYSLLQLYARPYTDGNGIKPGLPLRLKGETDDLNNDLVRSSVAEVYTQILDDLKFAEDNLPLTNSASNVTRAHRNTAIALKTRVYLSMGRYGDVITEANKIVSTAAPFVAPTGVRHALSPSIADVFAPSQETLETILAFPFTAQDGPGVQNQLAFYYLSAPGGNGEYSLNGAAGGILNNPGWAATDARRTAFVFTAGTESFIRKYPSGGNSAVPYSDKAPVIRYAEVLLNLAEARVRSTNTVDPQALLLLNAVRGRSFATGVYTAAGLGSVGALTDALLLERRIEFLGEGIRNIDLMRLNAVIPGKGAVPAIDPANPAYIWPIPSTELATNALMTRN